MRRSGYVSFAIAALVLGSRPDAAYVPAPRAAAAPRASIASTFHSPSRIPGFTPPSTRQQITATINP